MNASRDHDPHASTADLIPAPTSPGSSMRVRHTLGQGVVLAERYRVVRLLGQGAMGTVYQATDEARSGLQVALKLLAVHQPHALYRLKNEFRALAETVHPNLVGLHGLGTDPQGWFVVMDLIAPCSDFMSYVRSGPDGAFEEARLRSALIQLLSGVSAIHAAGKVHRDLKPSNVLVTREGRVVIADFGLVGDQQLGGEGNTHDGWFAGTPAYAAPEQAAGMAVGSKADLYAIGALLFEALTGRLPIEAESTQELLERKTRDSAPDPVGLAQNLPADLSALCRALLERDPASRPDVAEALALLDDEPLAPAALVVLPFVGREAELAALYETAQRARDGCPVVALVSGPSGIGKTALVARFLDLRRHEPATVVLRGRCHAREQVPYNAFDSLVDALGRYLAKLTAVDAASLMPRDVALLARLFPTLLRAPAVLQMPAGRGSEIDESLRRPRAFAALKELLARIADRASLILCFDDLQWSDDDSKELLRELLRSPGAPACLFVCTLRARDSSADDAVGAMLRAVPELARVELPLSPLETPAASTLARAAFGSAPSEADLRLVIEESAGSPFLLKELSRGASVTGNVVGLKGTVAAATEKLGADARSLLELVCAAGQPIALRLALRAARAAPQALPEILATVLLRTSMRGGCEYLESSHDRIRNAIIETVALPRLATLHEWLAQALSEEELPDPELIAHHYRAAGRPECAAPYTILAAERASRMLAFGRSVELYEIALSEAGDEGRGALELALADAYENLGRLNEAAACCERAAKHAALPEQQRDLSSKAMLLYLLAGQKERGIAFVRRLCRQLGVLAPPRWPWLSSLVRLFLLLRYLLGRRITTLPVPTERSALPATRDKLELCFRAARGLFNGQPDACVHFTLLSLIGARRYRDPHYWPQAMALEVMWRCTFRGEANEHDERDISRALALAEEQGDAEIVAGVLAAAGLCNLNTYRWEASVRALERAEAALNTCGRSAIHVFYATRPGRIAAWAASGQFAEILRHCDTWIAEARALGDYCGELTVRQLGSHRFLALDDPAAARQAIAEMREALGTDDLIAADAWWLGDVALYEGDAEGALAEDKRARRSHFFASMQRTPSHRIWCATHLARASLMAAAGGKREAHLRRAELQARRLARERLPLAEAAAAQIRGTLAMLRGDPARALAELESALELYVRCGMCLVVEATRFQLGKLRGGDEGAAQIRASKAAAAVLGARNPERWFRSLVPGFPD